MNKLKAALMTAIATTVILTASTGNAGVRAWEVNCLKEGTMTQKLSHMGLWKYRHISGKRLVQKHCHTKIQLHAQAYFLQKAKWAPGYSYGGYQAFVRKYRNKDKK